MDGHIAAGLLGGIRPDIARLPESGIVEVVNAGRGKPGLIPLWVGEGDQPTPAFIAEAANRALLEGQTFYTWQRGIPPLREALAGYVGRIAGTTVSPSRIYVTIGGMQAIMMTMQALVGPGDEVVLPAPVWPNIFSAVEIAGGRTVPVPIGVENGHWRLDLDRLFAACGPRTRALFLNSPGNPTGWTLTAEEQKAILDFCRARGIWIVADEVYARFVYDRPVAPSFLSIAAPQDRLVVVNTFSKNWAMTGWRIGWVVASEELGQVYENLQQFNTSGVPTFLQHGAVAAIEQGEDFIQSQVDRCRTARDLVIGRLSEAPRVRLTRPDGAFYLFFRVEGEPDSRALALRLLHEANVGLAPGSAFGPGGEGHLRLCFAGSVERLQTAMDRLLPALS
ncbi:aspartate aminotransferase [Inquilinus ginsengisoli]|uniref:pyridoxal phosphate-dependent aminotransferase n=1 Tax=Inquilinus ginsengisoli TaxID=363840 RepID=UPI003D248B5C